MDEELKKSLEEHRDSIVKLCIAFDKKFYNFLPDEVADSISSAYCDLIRELCEITNAEGDELLERFS